MTTARPDGTHTAGGPVWSPKLHFFEQVRRLGGFANHHAHLDKAYLIDEASLKLGQSELSAKWDLYTKLKERYTHADLVDRISRGVETMVGQGATYCRTMVDADDTVGLEPLLAAREVKKRYEGRIRFEIGVQPLKGVLRPGLFEHYEAACQLADYCGGLPARDHPRQEEHLDRVLDVAKRLGKPIDVHVDQANSPLEHETELLARKTIAFGLQGRVFAVHAISLAAQTEDEQARVIEAMREADLAVIICPSAALSMRQLPQMAPLHNSIAPFPKLRAGGVRCYLGVDNIYDLFMPVVDGDIWIECRMLMEACRFYDLDAVAEWACAKPPDAQDRL